ncbi:MFS transporter [Herminiimonas sp. KBW02]|uniref:MFS transporter n=1 Tax=Herminiimonas sp. KBW02 TaxID=2153363 RepID=UPI000F598DAE|nr:MFS transporter [Herminiimonas sp. KBW02]RQO36357.1 MFS transporter [Herminiimonas sp. KBW02]
MTCPQASAATINPCAVSAAAASVPGWMVWLFAVACGLSVANVYYAQPLLDALATDFGLATGVIGIVVTVTQAGSALALLLLVPLGDMLNRRRLLLTQLGALALALTLVAAAATPAYLLIGMLFVGMLGTAMTQGLIAYAATVAAPGERGRVVGTTQAGVLVGLLSARVLAGAIADISGWRMVYLVSAGLMLMLAVLLLRVLPRQQTQASGLSYLQLLASMGQLMWRERVLQVRGVIAMLMFAALSIFWSALVLPLSAAPYHYSKTAIGALGLIGVLGALAASRTGRWADQGWGQRTSAAALILLVLSWLPLALMQHGWIFLIVGIIALDLAGQAIHVTNQSMIFNVQQGSSSRLVGCYMLFYAAGSGLGAIAATRAFAYGGWSVVCLLGATVSGSALLFWWLSRPSSTENSA